MCRLPSRAPLCVVLPPEIWVTRWPDRQNYVEGLGEGRTLERRSECWARPLGRVPETYAHRTNKHFSLNAKPTSDHLRMVQYCDPKKTGWHFCNHVPEDRWPSIPFS